MGPYIIVRLLTPNTFPLEDVSNPGVRKRSHVSETKRFVQRRNLDGENLNKNVLK